MSAAETARRDMLGARRSPLYSWAPRHRRILENLTIGRLEDRGG
jgi:hypothetical protein